MPRHARIVLPGVAIHAIQRGNNRSACFFGDQDRSFYLFHLARMLPRVRCALHAYCLMDNHVHLLLSAQTADGCASLMKSIGQIYAQYVNKTYQRCGNLWEADSSLASYSRRITFSRAIDTSNSILYARGW
jgi:putative transposase